MIAIDSFICFYRRVQNSIAASKEQDAPTPHGFFTSFCALPIVRKKQQPKEECMFQKLIDWLAGALEYKPQARLHIEARGDYPQEVVGESHYQKHLRLLDRAWAEGGRKSPLIAELHCENDNEHDSKAVCVKIRGLVVGYLDREDARAYRKRMEKAELGEAVVSCNARIFGGTDGRKMFGVWLDLPIEEL